MNLKLILSSLLLYFCIHLKSINEHHAGCCCILRLGFSYYLRVNLICLLECVLVVLVPQHVIVLFLVGCLILESLFIMCMNCCVVGVIILIMFLLCFSYFSSINPSKLFLIRLHQSIITLFLHCFPHSLKLLLFFPIISVLSVSPFNRLPFTSFDLCSFSH